jgi:hypothetical protein
MSNGIQLKLISDYLQQKNLREHHYLSFGALTAVIAQILVFWVVTPSSLVGGYRSFGGKCCLHLQS